MHPDQPRTGCKRCLRESENVDGHRPGFGTVVGGSSCRQVMTTKIEELQLLDKINSEQNNWIEARAGELFELYYSTNDPDLRQIIASDLFIEFGKVVEL